MIVSLYIQPNASKTEIVGEHNGALKIKVKAPPVDGKANEEVIRFLSKKLDIPKSKIQLVSGQTSRHKRFLIEGLDSLDRLTADCK